MKNTVLTFKEAKQKGEKLTMLTAYDYSTAKLVDEAGVNSILVGDSLGMVMLGYEDTLSVTMEDMIHHTAAVARGTKNALVVGDMPFLSYNTGIRDAVINAGRLMSEGRANCVKLEGGKEVCDVIRAITDAKIPVCAHIGLTPQAVNALNACVNIYQQIEAITVYDLDCKHTNIIHVGKMSVGEVMNAVPENGHMEGTIRTYDSGDFDIIKKRMEEICSGLGIASGCRVDLNFKEGYPALLNDACLLDLVEEAALKTGASFEFKKEPYLLGEDFSFFSELGPVNYSFVGIRNEDLGYTTGLHTPTLQMREEALVYGVDFLVELVKAYCN